jgi:hypothetical protein
MDPITIKLNYERSVVYSHVYKVESSVVLDVSSLYIRKAKLPTQAPQTLILTITSEQ